MQKKKDSWGQRIRIDIQIPGNDLQHIRWENGVILIRYRAKRSINQALQRSRRRLLAYHSVFRLAKMARCFTIIQRIMLRQDQGHLYAYNSAMLHSCLSCAREAITLQVKSLKHYLFLHSVGLYDRLQSMGPTSKRDYPSPIVDILPSPAVLRDRMYVRRCTVLGVHKLLYAWQGNIWQS